MAEELLIDDIHLDLDLGQFKIHKGGIAWKGQGGGKVVEVDKVDIVGIKWMEVPRNHQLGVRINNGLFYKFTGFRDQDASNLTFFVENYFGKPLEERQLYDSGQNWREIDLSDVSHTQVQGQNEVMLGCEDTIGSNEIFRNKAMPMADVGPSGEDVVVAFHDIAILTPRGRCSVKLHLSFFQLQGKAMNFKINYHSVVRVFLLPKSNEPHTFVVVTLDPPICRGKTPYRHIVLQFKTDDITECTLSIDKKLLIQYNDRLKCSYKGLIHEVFTMILRGLSGAKVTIPGKFRSHQNDYAVNSSLKTEGGVLYPLDMGFFFLPKPPTLILNDEIDYIEFERYGVVGATCFDLVVRWKNYFDLDVRQKKEKHIFQNIQNNEFQNLYNFIRAKDIKIMKLREAEVDSKEKLKKKKKDPNASEEIGANFFEFPFEKNEAFRHKIISITDDFLFAKDSIVVFDGLQFHQPRGRYNVEVHPSFFLLKGQTGDSRIQYGDILGLFLLPKFDQHSTYVVISVNHTEQQKKPHIVLEFEDAIVECTLSVPEELLNNKYKDKLKPSYKGLIHEVFTTILQGLTGVTFTRPGKFRSCQNGYAIKSLLKTRDGVLYPLDEGFFFLPEPPTLILNNEIYDVEFERPGATVMDMHYFDFSVRLKNGQEYVFRNIEEKEYELFFCFICEKGLKIRNIEVLRCAGVTAVLQGNVDYAVQKVIGATDEEYEDVAQENDGDSPTGDDSRKDNSDTSESGGDQEKQVKKSRREASSLKQTTTKRKFKDRNEGGQRSISKHERRPRAEEKEPYETMASGLEVLPGDHGRL